MVKLSTLNQNKKSKEDGYETNAEKEVEIDYGSDSSYLIGKENLLGF